MAGYSTSVSTSILVFFLLLGFSAAKQVLVGGKIDAWKVPSSEADSLNKWSQKARFQVDDYLVWKYDGGKDSVLQVKKEDYANCNTSKPINEYNDGNTKVKLDRPGPFYFISGAKGHCENGEKIVVVVISPKRNRYIGISPSPSPSQSLEAPAIAPTSSATALKSGLVVMGMGVLAMYVGVLI
ncbi:hypothetical protein Lal_00020202 [Lupinus albus]|uniref:Putative cupredoxin n=1 Tax=Lupinus albus TaxID=3870 RepID=A0A6A5MEJ3_LUPAL|nr:putative cupredoxin [Lupinus albus]KAF1871409.1 hypothetical protein Lal_00020202 [Lupinus albus]